MDLNITLIEKHKRRSKADQLNRSFICGCGKSYLSYPALYTHIKTKHNGSNPIGTISSSISASKKRGRPKKPFESPINTNKILVDLDMFGGSSDAKSELVDSPLYNSIVQWEKVSDCKENHIKRDDAFALYLLDTAKVVDPSRFHLIVKFVENFRNCIEKIEDEETNKIPEWMENFIQNYIPLNIPSFDRSLAMKLAVHFSQWLLSKRLTDIKLALI